MKAAVTGLLLILPSLACAETPSTPEFSFLSSFIQMIAALAIVVGLILLTRHFSGKLTGAAATGTGRHIRLVETRYIAPRKSLLLVEVGGEYLLLSNTEQGLTLIQQVNVIEDIEVIEEREGARPGLSELFRREAGRWRR